MVESEPWTIGRLLQWTADYLKQHGAESPRLDAEVLLAHVRRCPRIELYTCFGDEADEATRTQYRDLVRRRAAGEPVAYLVGHREFYSREFRVTPAVLIPRPETEFVLIALLDLIKNSGRQQDPLWIADIGTGSGVLAVCAALNLPQARIVATDISQAALAVAEANADTYRVGDRIQFVVSDLLTGVPAPAAFDFIVSNPPYVTDSERSELPRDVVNHEPHQALFAGPAGLDILLKLLAVATERLQPGGWLLAEHSPPQAAALSAAAAKYSGLTPATFVDDLSKRPRVLRIQRRAVNPA